MGWVPSVPTMNNRWVQTPFMTGGGGSIQVPALTGPGSVGTLDSNSGWTWFNDPRAMCYSGNRRKMFVGWIQGATASDVVVAQYDLDTGGYKKVVVKAGFEIDDHDNPSLVILPDGRLIVFYVKHSADSIMRYRISTYPEDISEWGSELTNITNVVGGSSGFSYENPHYLANEGRLYLFARGNGYMPVIAYTNDPTSLTPTWTNCANLFNPATSQRPYGKYASDGAGKIHFFYTAGHPRDIADGACHLYHFYYDAADASFHKTDGTATKTLASVMAGTPLVPADVTKVYDTSEESGSSHGGNAWTWSIALANSGEPVCSFTTFPTLDTHRYHYAIWNGSAWSKNTITGGGPSLYGLTPQIEDMYSTGAVVDPSDTRVVWLCVMNAGATASELWKYRTLDGGSTWSSVRVTSGSETDKSFRPVVPLNKLSGAPDVLWQKGTYSTYTSWSSALKTGPSLSTVALPVNTVAPAITGATTVGDTATVSNGTWSNSPTGYTYQWRRSGTAISGATSSTYVIQSADADLAVTCTVTASNSGGPASATSNTLSPSGPPLPPVNSVAPAISGTTENGQTLTCSTGTWSGSPSYTYQWKRNGVAISGATASTYLLTGTDVGASVKCTVTATNVAGSASADSNTVTPTNPAAPTNSVAPAITGTTTTGQTLTCSSGTWTGSPTYAYQWKRNGSSISGATSSTYLLDVADEGTSVKCTVTATNLGGSASADSNTVNPTAPASGPFVNDTFTDTDSTTLQSHTGETGATWTKHTASNPVDAVIDTNAIRSGAASGAVYYASGSPPDAEYDVEAAIIVKSGVSGSMLLGRLSTGALTGYAARINSGSNVVQLYRYDAGAATLLDSSAFTPTLGNTYTLKLQIRNATKKAFVDGVQYATSTDNTHTAAGVVGLRTGQSETTSTGTHFASFSATDA